MSFHKLFFYFLQINVTMSFISQKSRESQRTPREAGGLLGWAVSKTAIKG